MPEAEKMESLKIPHAEAGLVRLYWMSQKPGEEPKLSLRSFLSCVAGSLLFRAGKVENLALFIGPEWGPDHDAISTLAKDMLIRLDVPLERVQTFSSALDSEKETAAFLEFAKERNFTKLIDIGFAKHNWTRHFGYQKAGHAVEPFVSVEQIIEQLAHYSLLGSGYQDLARKLALSKAEAAYALYEGGKFLVFSLGIDKLIKTEMEKRGKEPRPVIDKLRNLFGLDMDFYYLPSDKLPERL